MRWCARGRGGLFYPIHPAAILPRRWGWDCSGGAAAVMWRPAWPQEEKKDLYIVKMVAGEYDESFARMHLRPLQHASWRAGQPLPPHIAGEIAARAVCGGTSGTSWTGQRGGIVDDGHALAAAGRGERAGAECSSLRAAARKRACGPLPPPPRQTVVVPATPTAAARPAHRAVRRHTAVSGSSHLTLSLLLLFFLQTGKTFPLLTE